MDQKKERSKRVIYLASKLFKDNADGVELLGLLKAFHLETPTFPVPDIGKLERHGGALAWAAFREGNIDMLRKLELMANSKEYLNEQEELK